MLREVKETDRTALLDLWQAAWTEVLPEIDFAARRDWFSDYLRGLEASGAVTLVATAGSAPCGFINWHPGTGYIDQIAVDRAWQGQGVARALLDAAKSACPSGLTLKVNQQNPRAVRFYGREGFAITGEGVSAASGLKLWDMAWPHKTPASMNRV